MSINFLIFNGDDIDTFSISQNNIKNIYNIICKKYNITIKEISIYQNNIKLSYNFFDYNKNNNYMIIIKNNQQVINLKINYNNKIINLPKLTFNTTIKDIKNILSIKDDIFYKNEKLNDNNTIKDYNINNNSILSCSNLLLTI